MSGSVSAELNQLLNSPFEQRFDPGGYEANFSLRTDPQLMDMHARKIDTFLFSVIGYGLNTTADWTAEVGFLGDTQSLGYTAVEIPLEGSTPDHKLVFRRTDNGTYLPLSRINGSDSLFSSPLDMGHVLYTAPASHIDKLLEYGGYKLPPAKAYRVTDPRQQVSGLIERAKQWCVSETKSLASAGTGLKLSREMASAGHNGSEDMSTVLAATIYSPRHPSNSYRVNTTVEYIGSGFDIGNPTLRRKINKRDSDVADERSEYAFVETAIKTEADAPRDGESEIQAEDNLRDDLQIFRTVAGRILRQNGFYAPDAG